MLNRLILPLLLLIPAFASAKAPIFGDAEVGVESMYDFVCRHNPEFQRDVAEAFLRIGERYGIRGDVAFCQAIIETGWFRFDNGTAVEPESHNYCGLGVKKRGDKGCQFRTVDEGVTAMIQHLYAYACKNRIPKGEKKIDPRFDYVKRGSADSWEALSGRWAMNKNYGNNILRIYSDLSNFANTNNGRKKVVERIEVVIPDYIFTSDSTDFQPEYIHDVDSINEFSNR